MRFKKGDMVEVDVYSYQKVRNKNGVEVTDYIRSWIIGLVITDTCFNLRNMGITRVYVPDLYRSYALNNDLLRYKEQPDWIEKENVIREARRVTGL